MGGDDGRTLSIIIPTYRERANIEPLFLEFVRLKDCMSIPFEILVVDDGSPDGTRELASLLGQRYGLRVRVHLRADSRGMGTAIVVGLSLCDSDLLCVMDADLSHPPLLLPTLVDHLNGFDGTVASRYTTGGRIVSWSLHRKIISRVATKIAHHVLDTSYADPLSGYFLFRAASLRGLSVTGLGNKPLLEILGQSNVQIFEVPYEFRNRQAGKSKLTVRAIFEYLLLVMRIRENHRDRLALAKRISEETSTAPRDT